MPTSTLLNQESDGYPIQFIVWVSRGSSHTQVQFLGTSLPKGLNFDSSMAVPMHPDDPSWCLHSHLFKYVPNAVQGYVCEQIQVPKIYVLSLFPSPKLPVFNFVYGAHLPPVSKKGYNVPEGHSFFSTETPIDDVTILKMLHVPPTGIVAWLVDQLKQAWLDRSSSIQLPQANLFMSHFGHQIFGQEYTLISCLPSWPGTPP